MDRDELTRFWYLWEELQEAQDRLWDMFGHEFLEMHSEREVCVSNASRQAPEIKGSGKEAGEGI